MGGDYPGYKEGDLPISEKAWDKLIMLPMLSDPIEGAAENVIAAIRKIAQHADRLAAVEA